MKIEDVRHLQLTEMVLLREVDRICKLLNIEYYLIGGTLLGAVRHEGFIPWDVDIDIAMKRRDYQLFRKYCADANSDEFFIKTIQQKKTIQNAMRFFA